MEATLWSVVLLLTVTVHQGVSQLDNDQKQLLLDLHNWARGNATPRAADMQRMVRTFVPVLTVPVIVYVSYSS